VSLFAYNGQEVGPLEGAVLRVVSILSGRGEMKWNSGNLKRACLPGK